MKSTKSAIMLTEPVMKKMAVDLEKKLKFYEDELNKTYNFKVIKMIVDGIKLIHRRLNEEFLILESQLKSLQNEQDEKDKGIEKGDLKSMLDNFYETKPAARKKKKKKKVKKILETTSESKHLVGKFKTFLRKGKILTSRRSFLWFSMWIFGGFSALARTLSLL